MNEKIEYANEEVEHTKKILYNLDNILSTNISDNTNKEFEYTKKSLYNFFDEDINDKNNDTIESDYKLGSKGYEYVNRIRVATVFFILLKNNPEISFDDLEQDFTKKHGEKNAKKLINIIKDDVFYIKQIADSINYKKRQDYISYIKNTPTKLEIK